MRRERQPPIEAGPAYAGLNLAPGIRWNKHSADGRNVDQLTHQAETDMGASASFYDVRVFVEPA